MSETTSNSRSSADLSLLKDSWETIQSLYPFQIVILDSLGKLLFHNIEEQNQKAFTTSTEDLLSLVLHENCNETDCHFREMINQATEGYTEELLFRNDKVFKVIAKKLVEKQGASYLLTIQDITETKKMEIILKNSERRLRAFLDASPNVFLTVSFQGVIKSAHSNKREIQILQGNIIGKNIDEVLSIDTLEDLKFAISSAHEAGADLQKVEGKWISGSHPMSLEIRVVPGGARDVVLLLRDITDLYQKEENIKILERNSNFVEIASGMNQEMMTNLQSISNYARFLIKDQKDNQDLTYIKKIEELADITGKILQNVFSFSHYGDEKSQKVNLINLISEAVDYCRFGLNKNIQLNWSQEGEAWIEVPSKQMTGMIINLVMNAREAIKEKGTVTISCMEKKLQPLDRSAVLGDWSEGEFFQILIHDNGMGMDENLLAKIFNPLFSTKNAQGATGMGLTILKSFIHDIHGGLKVESTPGAGTEFSLYIPSSSKSSVTDTDEEQGKAEIIHENINSSFDSPLVNPDSAIELLEGNVELYRTICHDFILDYGDSIENIQQDLESQNLDKVRILVHSIKGLAGLVGSYLLQEVSRDFEKVIKEGDEKSFLQEEKRFKSILLQVLSELRNYLSTTEISENKIEDEIDFLKLGPMTDDQIRSLRALNQNLIFSEYNQALENISEMIQNSRVSTYSEALEIIKDWIIQFNFDKAYTSIENILKDTGKNQNQ